MASKLVPLPPERLRAVCDPDQFAFDTTDTLEELESIIGQERASEAIAFGIRIRHDGYNLFVLGPTGSGKRYVVSRFLRKQAKDEAVPDDWCYVHNFAVSRKPRTLRLPPGKGEPFRSDMARLIQDLRAALPAAFEADAYKTRRRLIESHFQAQRARALRTIQQRANAQQIALVDTEEGIALSPIRDGAVLSPEQLQSLPPEEQEAIDAVAEIFRAELEDMAAKMPLWEREHIEAVRDLDRDVCSATLKPFFAEVRKRYADLDPILAWLDDVAEDILKRPAAFLHDTEQLHHPDAANLQALLHDPSEASDPFQRYGVNVLVDHEGFSGAPMIYEDDPTLSNLVGRIEHRTRLGGQVTDFSMIRPGALHRANGGYLLIEARRLLEEPMAWEQLKRALRARKLKPGAPPGEHGLHSVSLDPEPIPLEVKVILIGERFLYYRLHELDPDFRRLFKVAADFEEDMPRTPETVQEYARLIATLGRQAKLRPLDRGAVARVVEHGARWSGYANRMSIHIQSLWTVLYEADHRASDASRAVVTAADIDGVFEAQKRRASRSQERLYAQIADGTILIDTRGERVGQVNGLAVRQVGAYAFGQPNRITARTYAGKGDVVNIDREVEMTGPIHDKGVMILKGYLGSRYTQGWPLALEASLVFEQSYGEIDGDSASLAELCALLSALANLPIYQGLAMTGSVNQYGEVQAVGGVNAKIEGFFDVCQARGLTGHQGVVLPQANVANLMLKREVVEAAQDGMFHVLAVRTVDQAMELLTNVPAGDAPPGQAFPERTINHRVQTRLARYAQSAIEWGGSRR